MKRYYFNQETADAAKSYISCIKRTADDYDMMFASDFDSMFHWIDRALDNADTTTAIEESISKLFNEAIPRILETPLMTEEDYTSIKRFEAKLKKIFEESISETTRNEYRIPESDASIKARKLLKQLEALA